MSSTDFKNVMKYRTDYFSLKEIDTILNYCLDNDRKREYLLFLLLFRSGRRISEVVGTKPYDKITGLRPCDIFVEDKLIDWCILKKNPIYTKTKKGIKRSKDKLVELKLNKSPKRALKPIDDYTLKILLAYIKNEGILSHTRVFPITRKRADQLIKEIAAACNITRPNKKIHCHQFRHSLAVNFLKKNPTDPAAIIKIMRILDHSSLELTQQYAQFTQEDIRESLNKLFGDEE